MPRSRSGMRATSSRPYEIPISPVGLPARKPMPNRPNAGERAPVDAVADGAFDMMDLIVLAIGLVFFALSIGYAYACDRL